MEYKMKQRKNEGIQISKLEKDKIDEILRKKANVLSKDEIYKLKDKK